MQSLSSLVNLSSEELKCATLNAAKTEKTATHVLLEHIAEVDRRWLFAEWGHESLHAYIRDALGYSNNEAYERKSAAKLLRKLPEIRIALENGGHTLTSAAKISSHVAREKATTEEVRELVKRCENQSTREIERILVGNSTQTIPTPDKIKPVSTELTRLTLEVDQEFMALLTRMKELKGNPAITLKDLFQSAMTEFTKRREPKVPRASQESRGVNPKSAAFQETGPKEGVSEPFETAKSSPPESSPPESSPPGFWAVMTKRDGVPFDMETQPEMETQPGSPQNKSRTRYIPASERNRVRLRSNDRCEYRDPASGRRCECRIGLEFDHFPIPFAMGGASTSENLRHACRTHNRFHAVRIYGKEKMKEYLRH